jgi:hypothetical protein
MIRNLSKGASTYCLRSVVFRLRLVSPYSRGLSQSLHLAPVWLVLWSHSLRFEHGLGVNCISCTQPYLEFVSAHHKLTTSHLINCISCTQPYLEFVSAHHKSTTTPPLKDEVVCSTRGFEAQMVDEILAYNWVLLQ